MPDSHSPLTPAETQRLFRTALTSGAAVGWSPPEPSELAPYFPGYEIEALIARGGMGAVYRARQLSLNRPVAIKLLPFDLGMREDFAERFRREAEALARLQHPHIVAVHDFGQADDGHYFMVMELVEGTDLATRLRNEGALPPAEALRIVRQVCEALQFAHQRGVVHRDIKPANVLLDEAGQVKVADFGIAQFAQAEAAGDLTMTGTLLGTPDYTAPEQLIVSGAVDHRADIFSLGVMLYQLLTGQLPRGVYRPVSEIVPSMRGLDAVLARAMQSDPARRYGQVLELSAGLTDAPSGRWLTAMWSTGALLCVIAAIVWVQQPKPASFTNSLGLTFVPAGTPGVLFCTTETRVRDFAASEVARRAQIPVPVYVNYEGPREAWLQKDGTWKQPLIPQTPEHPVIAVTYEEAVAYCEWLTLYERGSGRIDSQDRYRLPTMAEWSIAAGLEADAHDPANAYPWHGTYPPPADAGNYASDELRTDPAFAKLPVISPRDDGHAYTAPVASFSPNRHGLYDMGGNVAEWIASAAGQETYTRGATWLDSTPEVLDAGYRPVVGRDTRSFILGFRMVLERPDPP